ncbi:MAG: prepilin peptidase [Lactovum sp.]
MKIFLIFCLGASFGSFFTVLIERLSGGHSLLFPSSHCNNCQHPLRLKDLIPILSQVLSKSSCRYCAVKIPLWYGFLEFLSGILFLLVFLQIISYSLFFFLLMSSLLSIFDFKSHNFPFSVWLFFTFLILFTGNFQPFHLIFLCLSLLSSILPLKIGSGDFLWLFSAALTLKINQFPPLIFIASMTGIIFILIKKEREIAFIPHLTLAYLILTVLPQIQ